MDTATYARNALWCAALAAVTGQADVCHEYITDAMILLARCRGLVASC